jgi:hypothetical protein
MKSCFGIRSLPVAQLVDYVLYFFDFVLCAFARIDVRNMDDGFFIGVQHAQDFVAIGACVKVIADIQLLEGRCCMARYLFYFINISNF